MTARVAIVIPTWNRAELLGQVLENLRDQTYPVQRVIVVDNGSTDHSVQLATSAGAQVISLGRNAGFAAAVNQGIQEVASSGLSVEYVGVLNNDVVLQPTWLACLMSEMEDSSAWFATGKLLDAHARERIDGSFDAVCRGGCAWRCGQGRPDSPLWNQRRSIRLAPLTAAVFRAEVFQRVGLLDEQFESYLEDVDLGLRCAEAGLDGVYVPQAIAYHQGSGTLGRWHPDTVRRMARNQILLVAKHYPRNWVLSYGWPVFIAQILWGFVALRHGALASYFAGKVEGVRGYRSARGKYSADFPAADAFPAILEQSEKEIRDLQQASGFDLYWRLYFALT
jgi:GT2 family glycosyltransferase